MLTQRSQVIYILHDGAYPTTDVGTSLLRALGLVSLDSSYASPSHPLILIYTCCIVDVALMFHELFNQDSHVIGWA